MSGRTTPPPETWDWKTLTGTEKVPNQEEDDNQDDKDPKKPVLEEEDNQVADAEAEKMEVGG